MSEGPDRRAEVVLAGLVRLLEHCGEARWIKWARHHLELAKTHGRISPTLVDAYGGRGSFNDLVLSDRHHALERMQVPWANELLAVLGERAYQLSVEVSDERFTAGWVRPPDPPVGGWRCLVCGYSEITDYDIEEWAARILVPAHISDETLADGHSTIETILSGQAIGATESRADVMARAAASSIAISFRDEGMQPCPECGSADIARYRWVFAGGGLHPAENNLELREPGHQYRAVTDVASVSTVLEELEARSIQPGVWHVGPKPTNPMLDAQVTIMDAIRGLPAQTYLTIYDELEGAEARGWRKVGEYTWSIPAAAPSRLSIQIYLEPGAWHMYQASAPLEEGLLPDLFKTDAESISARLVELGVLAMIDAWHDNTEWRIAVALSGS